MAADLRTKHTGLSRKPAYIGSQYTVLYPLSPLVIITQPEAPKADTYFTVPWRAEGRVDLDGWLYTQTVYLPVSSPHPSSNRAQCRLTTLIELNALTTIHYAADNSYKQWTEDIRLFITN